MKTNALGLIELERIRQTGIFGFDAAHDDTFNKNGELIAGAACYLDAAEMIITSDSDLYETKPEMWPWDAHWHPSHDPVRNLVKSAAMIVAEIERLLRAKEASGEVEA